MQVKMLGERASQVTSNLSNFNFLYFTLFHPLTSFLQTLKSSHLWDYLVLPLSDDLPCRRVMVMERGCRNVTGMST